jgi:hypothetical protein
MHTSKVQIKQAPRQMLCVWVDTNVSPWYKVFASLAPMFSRREAKQYPIPPRQTARVMTALSLAMRSRFPAV